MAEIYNNQISIAFDVYGCPQRCKHCLLVHPKHAAIDADEVISTFARLKHEHNQNRYYGSEVQYLSVDFRNLTTVMITRNCIKKWMQSRLRA